MMEDYKPFEKKVRESVDEDVELNQNQFDALVDFAFNVGGGAFGKSTLKKELNDGVLLPHAAQFQFSRWKGGPGKCLAGLARRRFLQAELFNSCDDDFCSTDAKCPSSFWHHDYKKCGVNCYYCVCPDCKSSIKCTSNDYSLADPTTFLAEPSCERRRLAAQHLASSAKTTG